MELTNPYYAYPGFPFSGYHKKDRYNAELIKLNEYLQSLTLDINSKTILHMNFGSAMEELYSENRDIEIKFQWQQLFPEHIQRAILENPDFQIILITITPSKCFEKHYQPSFIEKTPELKWYSDGENSFRSKIKNNLIVKSFNCPMPSNYDYTPIIENLQTSKSYPESEINKMIQTETDKMFINKFYSNIETLFNKVNYYDGLITCFSSAVFRQGSQKDRFINYHLFKEIKNLFVGEFSSNKRILAEWLYRVGYYCVNIYNTSDRENAMISYVKPETLESDDLTIFKLKLNTFSIYKYTHKIKKEFENKDTLYESLNIKDNTKINNIKKVIVDIFNNEILNKNDFNLKPSDEIGIIYNNYSETDNKKINIMKMMKVPENGRIFSELELDYISKILKKNIIVYNEKKELIYNTFKNSSEFNNYEKVTLLYHSKKMTFSLIKEFDSTNYCLSFKKKEPEIKYN